MPVLCTNWKDGSCLIGEEEGHPTPCFCATKCEKFSPSIEGVTNAVMRRDYVRMRSPCPGCIKCKQPKPTIQVRLVQNVNR